MFKVGRSTYSRGDARLLRRPSSRPAARSSAAGRRFSVRQDLDPVENDIILACSNAAWDELKATEGVIPLFP
jgi:hypothetical protein